MQKKSTTPRKSAASKPTRIELRKQLARDLAAVMANPETPAILYNDIGGSLTEMSNDLDYDSPEMIERCVISHLEKEEKRKGGAR